LNSHRILANGALLTLMLGHFTNDLYGGVLPVLFPSAKERFNLGNAELGLVTLAYTSASSLAQPFFGHLSDRYGRRWFAPAVLLWGASWVSLYGFAGSFGVFLALAALAGLGSGAYHPFGASNAAAVTDERDRNTALSVYTVGGTSGYALGPLVGVALLWAFGPKGTGVLFLPGVLAAALIYSQMGRVERARGRRQVVREAQPVNWPVLARVVGLVMLRAWAILAVVQFVPVWYDELGYSAVTYGWLTTTIILSGVLGTLAGGLAADRIGPKAVMVSSLLCAIPPLLLFAAFPGPLAFVAGAAFGIFCDASLSVTLVSAQRLMPGRTGVASGMILGIGFITGGIGVPITGLVADAIGMQRAIASLALLCLAGAVVGWSIPRRALQARPIDDGDAAREPAVTAAVAPGRAVGAGE
jgi:FSR family fosmidomycin resistance protein-like MFS transporter